MEACIVVATLDLGLSAFISLERAPFDLVDGPRKGICARGPGPERLPTINGSTG
jgi:hypothetical protein